MTPEDADIILDLGEHLLGRLQGLEIHVDQLLAELRDPATFDARRQAILAELRGWQTILREATL